MALYNLYFFPVLKQTIEEKRINHTTQERTQFATRTICNMVPLFKTMRETVTPCHSYTIDSLWHVWVVILCQVLNNPSLLFNSLLLSWTVKSKAYILRKATQHILQTLQLRSLHESKANYLPPSEARLLTDL